MADEKKPPQPAGLDKPAGAEKAKDEPIIHVIPEQFYGAALKQRVKKSALPPVEKKPEPRKPGQPPVPPKPGAKPPVPKKGANKNKKLIMIGAGVGILLVIVIAVVILMSGQKESDSVCGDNICLAGFEDENSCPADCGPAPAVCGNNVCEEETESVYNCSLDCGEPPAICGDKTCEGGETPYDCPIDCGEPPPECGDNQCNGEEDHLSCPQDCEAPMPMVTDDTDSDGLTDIEERDIYGSRPDHPDSDNDQYVDLNEILNLYNPIGDKLSLLIENPGITLYRNSDFGFGVLRPIKWTVVDELDILSVSFVAPTGERISVAAREKSSSMPLIDFVKAEMPESLHAGMDVLVTKQGYAQVFSKDRRQAFVAKGRKVYVLTYDLGDQLDIRYRVTFNMMVNSLMILDDE